MDEVSYEWWREADLEHLVRAFEGMPSVMLGYILGPCWARTARRALALALSHPVMSRHAFPATYKGRPRLRLHETGTVRRRSWHFEGKEIKGAAADIKFYSPHAHLVEFGTARGAPAQPFLEPAMREAGKENPGVISTLGRKRFVKAIDLIRTGTAPATLARSVAQDV